MKRVLAALAALLMILAVLPRARAEAPAETTIFRKAWLGQPAWGYSGDVAVLILTNDPAQGAKTAEEIGAGIRYFPFDAASGVYSGNGEPAGDRAEILTLAAEQTVMTLRLGLPGKYDLCGIEYYFFDRGQPALAALLAELDEAVENCRQKDEKQTAKKLHDWVCNRVSSVFPEDEAEAARLAAVCGDPVNALLTGYASREAYARLFDMLLGAAGIRSLTVSGQADGEDASWCLTCLDGTWCWTDAAMDDQKDRKSSKALSVDDKTIGKDHVLSAEDQAFVTERIRANTLDMLFEGTLPFASAEVDSSNGYFEFCWVEGSPYVVGKTATVTFRRWSNENSTYGIKTLEEFCQRNIIYLPWLEYEGQEFYAESYIPGYQGLKKDELPVVEEAAEDRSSVTVTFLKPGLYRYGDTNFYLLDPDQPELVALAEEMDAVVAKAKTAATEKETARQLIRWVCKKLSYGVSYKWNGVDVLNHTCDAVSSLIFGKTMCGGYEGAYRLLLDRAGLTNFGIVGDANGEGHVWCANRLDGVWSYSDPTWMDTLGETYFAQNTGKLWKSHLLRQPDPEQMQIWFGNPFMLQTYLLKNLGRFELDIPHSLQYLPATANGYGFPEKQPDFPVLKALSADENSVDVTFSKTVSKIIIARMDAKGNALTTKSFMSKPSVSTFSAPLTPDEPFCVQIRMYDSIRELKKPTVWEQLNYEDGELTDAVYRYIVPMKADEIIGFSEISYRYFDYDMEMKPKHAGWYLNSPDLDLTVEVFFSPEGNVSSCSVEYIPQRTKKLTWTMNADSVLTEQNGYPVSSPEEADPAAWVPIWFE